MQSSSISHLFRIFLLIPFHTITMLARMINHFIIAYELRYYKQAYIDYQISKPEFKKVLHHIASDLTQVCADSDPELYRHSWKVPDSIDITLLVQFLRKELLRKQYGSFCSLTVDTGRYVITCIVQPHKSTLV